VTLTSVVLGGLAVWRVSQLVVRDDGPWRVFARLRRRAETTAWGGLVNCIYCFSLWIAVPVAWALGDGWWERVLAWPALSGAALVVDRLTQSASGAAATVDYLEEADDDGLLRTRSD
jgi:hypothetical protein